MKGFRKADVLASAETVERSGDLEPGSPHPPGGSTGGREAGLVARFAGCLEPSGKKGGSQTGPNPTDRGRAGSKHHVIVERRGIPLAAQVGPANQHDSKVFESLIDAIPAVRNGRRGRPRRRPEKLHADKGYDFRRCREACRQRGVKHRIARRGVESKERLGIHRWVVERTFAWLHRFRRLAVRYERRADIHQAFLHLGCILICWYAKDWAFC